MQITGWWLSGKKKHLEAWVKVDRLKTLLNSPDRKESSKLEIKALIHDIYEVHEGLYRQYSFEDVWTRFQLDWKL